MSVYVYRRVCVCYLFMASEAARIAFSPVLLQMHCVFRRTAGGVSTKASIEFSSSRALVVFSLRKRFCAVSLHSAETSSRVLAAPFDLSPPFCPSARDVSAIQTSEHVFPSFPSPHSRDLPSLRRGFSSLTNRPGFSVQSGIRLLLDAAPVAPFH